ncbi:sensor histidine kinase [Streptomyces yanii]|uniref:Sensor histidine kinase n=2 Tax=Streptomyces TaxID=1883 RepID=A0ABV5RHS7_9ACTN
MLLAVVLGQYAKRRSHRRGLLLLTAQTILTYLPVLVFKEVWLSALGLLLGAALAFLPRPAGLVAAAAVAASGPLVIFALPVDNRTAVYVAARTVVIGLVVYGIVRLASVAAQAHAMRHQSARLAVHRERTRVAQDLHDILGSALSTIAVKSEVAGRLSDPVAMRAELVEIAGLARQAVGEVRGMARDHIALSFAEELAAAHAALEAAGIDVRLRDCRPALPAGLENCLGAALREGVTNILRHSAARLCTLEVTEAEGAVKLSIENDGVSVTNNLDERHGSGLSNLAIRAATLGGVLTYGPTAPGFRIAISVPVHAPVKQHRLSAA